MRTTSLLHPQRARAFAALAGMLALLGACDDQAPSAPSSLKSPSRFLYAPTCIGPDKVWYAPDACPEDGIIDRLAYVTNEESGSIAYVEAEGRNLSLQDALRGVPGLSPVPVGDRPRALAATPEGAFILTINTVSGDLSVVETARQREVKRFDLSEGDAPSVALDLISDPAHDRFWVAHSDNRLQSLALRFDCGQGENVYSGDPVAGTLCALDVESVAIDAPLDITLPAQPNRMQLDPTRPLLYIAYTDATFLSVIGLEESTEACIDGAAAPPCEVARLPGGFGCSDGLDNDGDGFADGLDPQCHDQLGAESPEGVGIFQRTGCTDGLDNDGDGFVDALDPGCLGPNDDGEEAGLQALTPAGCVDGLDNDGDGLIDNRDPDCFDPEDEETTVGIPTPACDDGFDNDGDGQIDLADADCDDPDDPSESSTPACSDGVDSDGDGLVDLDDDGCASPSDETEFFDHTACSDGADSDGDGLIDTADPGCYGARGVTEREVNRVGMGPIGINPLGRWLYVVDRSEWQVLVIDLETRQLIPAGLRSASHSGPGVLVQPLPRAIVGDVRDGVIFDADGVEVTLAEAFFYTASTAGVLEAVTVHQTVTRVAPEGDTVLEQFTLRIADSRTSSEGNILALRCSRGRCEDEQLPAVTLRRRPIIGINNGEISDVDEAGAPLGSPADEIFRAESWAISFEGILPGSNRSDGLVDDETPAKIDGRGANYCSQGVVPGDRFLILDAITEDDGQIDPSKCTDFINKRHEWRITHVRRNALYLEPIVDPDDPDAFATAVPNRVCFPRGLRYAVRPTEEWTVVGETTSNLLALATRQDVCVEPRYRSLGNGRLRAGERYENTFFSIDLAEDSIEKERTSIVNFDVFTGYSALRRGIGPLPADLKLIDNGERRFLVIPDADQSRVFVYDADSLGQLESL